MIQTIRHLLVASPMSLVLIGCSGGHRSEFRTTANEPPKFMHSHFVTESHEPTYEYRRTFKDTEPNVRAPEGYGLLTSGSRYDITLDEFRQHVKNGTAVIIDARAPETFARGHVRGALNMPVGDKENYFAQIKKEAGPDELIIIYCGGPQCPASDVVYDFAASHGFINMRVYKPGWQTLSTVSELQ